MTRAAGLAFCVFVISVSLQGLNGNIEEENTFRVGYKNIPHPDKVDKGGEDAFYFNSKYQIAFFD
jgi:hypothetical protein